MRDNRRSPTQGRIHCTTALQRCCQPVFVPRAGLEPALSRFRGRPTCHSSTEASCPVEVSGLHPPANRSSPTDRGVISGGGDHLPPEKRQVRTELAGGGAGSQRHSGERTTEVR